MKKVFCLLVLAFSLAAFCNAQNLIALEHGSNTTFYKSLDSVLAASNNGDNIYLPGGYIQFTGTILISKSINIYGVGYNIDSSIVTGNTVLQNNIEILSGVTSGSINGIFNNNGYLTIHDSVSNIKISRCIFYNLTIGSALSNVPANNITINESIIYNGILANCTLSKSPQNVSLINSFFGRNNSSTFYRVLRTNGNLWEGLLCRNCIFWGRSGQVCCYENIFLMNQITYSKFENCIIFDNNCSLFGVSNSQFYNCLLNCTSSYLGNQNFNCIYGQDMISNVFKDTISNDYFDIHVNYRLKDTSPGKNAGTDGTDIGLYGGSYPWKAGALPINPHYQFRKVGGKTDGNGNLPVQIKIKAQDN